MRACRRDLGRRPRGISLNDATDGFGAAQRSRDRWAGVLTPRATRTWLCSPSDSILFAKNESESPKSARVNS